jgi:hypothetical protein
MSIWLGKLRAGSASMGNYSTVSNQAGSTSQDSASDSVMTLSGQQHSESTPGLCCRPARVRGVIGAAIFCAILIGLPILWWDAPWPMWVVLAVGVAVFVPVLIRNALAKLRSDAWVMQVRPDGVWINLRSPQSRSARDPAQVLQLCYQDIACVHRHVATWTTPRGQGSFGSTMWKLEALDLRLVSDDTTPIARLLRDERRQTKAGLIAVAVPADGVLRIAWRSGLGHDLVPSLAKVLDVLRPRVQVTDTTHTDRPNWRKLSDAEVQEVVTDHVRWGDPVPASELLVYRGLSATEAHRLVEATQARV